MRPNETTELTVTTGRDVTETLLQLCAHQLSSLLPGAELTAADLWLSPKTAGRSVVGLEQVATNTKDLGGDATAVAAGYKIAAPTVQQPVAFTFLAKTSDAQLSVASVPDDDGSYTTAVTFRWPNRLLPSNYQKLYLTMLAEIADAGLADTAGLHDTVVATAAARQQRIR